MMSVGDTTLLPETTPAPAGNGCPTCEPEGDDWCGLDSHSPHREVTEREKRYGTEDYVLECEDCDARARVVVDEDVWWLDWA